MKNTFFFLNGFLKRPVIWLALAVLAFVSVFSFSTETLRSPLPCAVYSKDQGEEAEKVVRYLEENGFFAADSEETAGEMVLEGTADCAVVLAEDFSVKLREGSLKNCAELLVSERSQKTSMYKLMAAVAIYQIYMPYTAAETAELFDYKASVEDIENYRETVLEKVNPLEFHVISVEGADISPEDNFDLPVGVISLSCFTVLGFLCTVLIRRRGTAVSFRFPGFGSYLWNCILPQCTAAGILTYAAAAAGILIVSRFFAVPLFSLLLAMIPYLIILILVMTVLTVLPVSDHLLICIIAIDASLSLLLCPLYSGTNLLLGYIGPFRVLSIPYYIYPFLAL